MNQPVKVRHRQLHESGKLWKIIKPDGKVVAQFDSEAKADSFVQLSGDKDASDSVRPPIAGLSVASDKPNRQGDVSRVSWTLA